MTLIEIAKRVENLAVNNAPTIMTSVGVAGVIGTAILTGKASFRAAEILSERRHEFRDDDEPREVFKKKVNLVWREYIPPIGMAALTITAIVSSNRIGSRRAAAVAAAYSISEQAIAEYKEKVVEKLGDRKEQAIRDEIAQERINRNPVEGAQIILTGTGEVLCYDMFSDRHFKSSVETIKKAQNDTNYQIIREDSASLSEFYSRVGIPTTSFSDNIGWNTDAKLEVAISTMLSETQEAVITMDFRTPPKPEFWKF